MMGLWRCVVVAFMLVCVSVVVPAIDRTMLRTYFRCPPCDESACPIPKGCREYVKESGICGCCLTCARGKGDPCGVFTERCSPGLTCKPIETKRKGEEAWTSLFKGKGICVQEMALENMVSPDEDMYDWS